MDFFRNCKWILAAALELNELNNNKKEIFLSNKPLYKRGRSKDKRNFHISNFITCSSQIKMKIFLTVGIFHKPIRNNSK